jgi:hypothetical protein
VSVDHRVDTPRTTVAQSETRFHIHGVNVILSEPAGLKSLHHLISGAQALESNHGDANQTDPSSTGCMRDYDLTRNLDTAVIKVPFVLGPQPDFCYSSDCELEDY